MVEIYCEVIKDLLSISPGGASLAVQQDREHGLIIAGAVKVGSFHMNGETLATALPVTDAARLDQYWCCVGDCSILILVMPLACSKLQ